MNYSPSKSTEAVVQYLLELDRAGVVGFDAIKNAVTDRSLRRETRNTAITLLQFLADRTVCPAPLELVGDIGEEYTLRSGAAFTLGVLSCRSEIDQALEVFAIHPDETTRVLLIRSFWWGYTYGVPGKRLIDTMFACVQNPAEPMAVRAEAAAALGNMIASGSRADEIFAGLARTLTASLPTATPNFKYQLLYALGEIATGARSESRIVQAALPALTDSLQKLFDDPADIDGDILGEYACDVFGRLQYMGFLPKSTSVLSLFWHQSPPALA